MSSSSVLAVARVAATFRADAESAREARRLTAETLQQWGADHLIDDAALLVSELVTNAVVHAGTDVELAAALHEDAVVVAVTDHHPARPVPEPPFDIDVEREGGRGLALIAAVAPSWGVDYSSTTKRVWFRLPLATGPLPGQRPSQGDAGGSDSGDGGDEASDAPEAVVATVQLDQDGLVTAVDAHAEALLGRPAAELVGTPWPALCDDQDAAVLLAAASVPRWQGSYRVRRSGAGYRRVLARHVRLPATGPEQGPITVCVLVDHRLRVLVGDAGGPGRGPSLPDGPFVSTPDLLVRLELEELLDRTLAWARERFEGDGAYALLVSDDEEELVLRATVGNQPPGMVASLPRGHGATSVPTLFEDVAAKPDHEPWLASTGARSAMTAPLLAGGRLVGSLVVTATRPNVFTVEEATALQRAADSVSLAVASARFAEVEHRRHGWLGYLAEASEMLAGTLEFDRALALVAQLVAPRLGPWCAIYLVDDDTSASRLAFTWHSDEELIDELARCLESAPPPAPAAGSAPVRWQRDETGGHAVALVARGRVLGALLVGERHRGGGRRQDLFLLSDLAPRAALALDNARMYAERTTVSQILQRSLLPPELPELAGLDVGVVYEANGAANEVGGDFYDIFSIPSDDGEHFGFAVGDVCGKGPDAAAVTGLARTALRVLGRRGDDVVQVLTHLNSAILAEGSRSRFLTTIYGEGRVDDGGVTLRFACAGHPRPALLRADGTVEQVGGHGDLLGVFERPEVDVTQVRLAPGESLVCFTDGVTERRSGDVMLGEDGVLAVLRAGDDLTAAALARRLGNTVRDFATAPARDDVAVLVLRAVRPPRRRG